MTLDEWLERKREQRPRTFGPLEIRGLTPSIKDFLQAVSTFRGPLAVVAELARATPEEGTLATDLDLEALVGMLDAADIAALAVATDTIACGALESDLAKVCAATTTPVLARDLYLTRDSLYPARLQGADAVLLTAAAVSAHDLKGMLEVASSLHLAAPIEVRSAVELDMAIAVGARSVVLPAFAGAELDLTFALSMLDRVPRTLGRLVRGPFRSAEELEPLRGKADAIWIAGPLMRAADRSAFIRALVTAADGG